MVIIIIGWSVEILPSISFSLLQFLVWIFSWPNLEKSPISQKPFRWGAHTYINKHTIPLCPCMLSGWWEMARNSLSFCLFVCLASWIVIHASEERANMKVGPFRGLSYRDRMVRMESMTAKASSFALSPSSSYAALEQTVTFSLFLYW